MDIIEGTSNDQQVLPATTTSHIIPDFDSFDAEIEEVLSGCDPSIGKDDLTKVFLAEPLLGGFFYKNCSPPPNQELLQAEQQNKTSSSCKSRGQGAFISFSDMARLVEDRWKVLSKEEKVEYEYLAAVDTERYEKEMKKWKQSRANIKSM
mmetsp:Transcript_14329/g.18726  ORF Transcript_14329/g.18726 Transcript_14329/m.18726 type:complete len:150 (+) Transcript_14329:204-653(+)